MNEITIEIPNGFYNCTATKSNHFIADTNDSGKWDKLKLPLPPGKWSIYSQSGRYCLTLLGLCAIIWLSGNGDCLVIITVDNS